MSATDVAFIGVMVLVCGLLLFVGHFVLNTTVDSLLASPLNSSDESVSVFNVAKDMTSRFDYGVLIVFLALTIGLIITSWLIGGNGLYMLLYFMLIVIFVGVSFILTNMWDYLVNLPSWSGTIVAFPITNNLLLNLPIYSTVIGFVGIVTMFAKPYFGKEY